MDSNFPWSYALSLIFEWLFFAVGYFSPTILAKQREHTNVPAIFLLNLLLGWTFVFWAIALVWAFVRTPEQKAAAEAAKAARKAAKIARKSISDAKYEVQREKLRSAAHETGVQLSRSVLSAVLRGLSK